MSMGIIENGAYKHVAGLTPPYSYMYARYTSSTFESTSFGWTSGGKVTFSEAIPQGVYAAIGHLMVYGGANYNLASVAIPGLGNFTVSNTTWGDTAPNDVCFSIFKVTNPFTELTTNIYMNGSISGGTVKSRFSITLVRIA